MKTSLPVRKLASAISRFAGSSALARACRIVAVPLAVLACAAAIHAQPVYQVRTMAGVTPGSVDGPAGVARFSSPSGIAVDAAGNLFVADTQNHTLRKIAADGTVSTILGSPRQSTSLLAYPGALALGSSGNFLVSTNGNIREISPKGELVRQLGGGVYTPGVAVGSDGSVYYAMLIGNRIEKVSPTGSISVVAGSASGASGSADGTGADARFQGPTAIAVSADGTLYVADGGNYTIRKIDAAGVVTTIAGAAGVSASTDGTGAAARFLYPWALAIDATGTLYVVDGATAIRKVTAGGVVTMLAGAANASGNVDGVGTAARFQSIWGIVAAPDGQLYVTDNSTIRLVAPDGTVTTLVGVPGQGSADGTLAEARLSQPSGVTVAGNGDVFVVQSGGALRRITSAGVVSTLAGLTITEGTQKRTPSSVAVASDGTIYAGYSSNRTITKTPPLGATAIFAGTSGVSGHDDGVGTAATFSGPGGLALDAGGNLIVADGTAIRKIAPNGTVTTLAGGTYGTADGQGADASFRGVNDVAIDGDGAIWAADYTTVRKITPGGLVTTVAGRTDYTGYASDGTGAEVQFRAIAGIAVAPTGELYVTDGTGNTIRRVTPAGVVTTIAGRDQRNGSSDGPAREALFNYPQDVYVDGSGTIYVADLSNNAIRVIVRGAAPTFDAQPQSATVNAGGNTTLTAHASGADAGYRWLVNGNTIDGQTGATLPLNNLLSANAGLYAAVAAKGLLESTSSVALIGVATTSKVIGAGAELTPVNIRHPNGNIFDQVLLSGVAETITADPGQITRTSFIDLDGNIVQVEFGGAGSLSLVLSASSGPALPTNYNQNVAYMTGHAGLVIAGADETTNVSVFTVGRATAFDPTGHYDLTKPISETNNPANNGSTLFVGKEPPAYAGIAKIGFIAIASANGKFGGVRAANAKFSAWGGFTGVYAPGVIFTGPLFVGNITAYDEATPAIVTGSAGDVRVTGGNLFQDNGRAVQVHGFTQLKFTAGSDSSGQIHPAQANQAALVDGGVDVTAAIVVNP